MKLSKVPLTLGPAYNEHFNAGKCAPSNRVLIVTQHFNNVVNDRLVVCMVLNYLLVVTGLVVGGTQCNLIIDGHLLM